MKLLLIVVASALSATLVVPTVSQGQSRGAALEPLAEIAQQATNRDA